MDNRFPWNEREQENKATLSEKIWFSNTSEKLEEQECKV